MRAEPLVSVIIPTRNYARYLPEAIESALGQSYSHIECIVVDDGSTDNSAETVNRMAQKEPRLLYIRQENLGVSAARNRGIRSSSGEYIQLLDADDLLEIDKIAEHKAFLDVNHDTDIVYGQASYFRDEKEGCGDLFAGQASEESDEAFLRGMIERNGLVISSPLIRSSVFSRYGMFKENMRHLEDWEFWLRCAMKGARFRRFDPAGSATLIRIHDRNISGDFSSMIKAHHDLRAELGNLLENSALKKTNMRHLDTARLLMAYERIKSGETLPALIDAAALSLSALRPKSLLYALYLAADRIIKKR